MSDPLFITQERLEGWIAEGEVVFADDVLTLPSKGVTYHLQPAVRVTQLLDGVDALALVGQVRAQADLAAMGAEVYRSSLILGDAAYECEEGFVGLATEPKPGTAPLVEPATATPTEASADMALLTDFLLKNL
ncbi:MAG: hypothetical protein AAB426_11350 [Myxococcota bacterium]